MGRRTRRSPGGGRWADRSDPPRAAFRREGRERGGASSWPLATSCPARLLVRQVRSVRPAAVRAAGAGRPVSSHVASAAHVVAVPATAAGGAMAAAGDTGLGRGPRGGLDDFYID